MSLRAKGINTLLFLLWTIGAALGQYEQPYTSVSELRLQVKVAPNDSVRSWLYIVMANTYLEENLLDSCLWAAQKAKQLAASNKIALMEAWADQMTGTYYFYQGSYDKGIELQNEVAAKAEKLHDPLLRANARKMMAWMYTEMGKEKEAMLLFKESLPVFKKFSARDIQMNIGITYYGIGTAYFYLGQYDSARSYYDSAIAARPAMDSREMALALADRASVLRDHENKLNAALADVIQAVSLLKKAVLQNDALAYAEAELALTYAKLGQLGAAESWAVQAYERYEKIPLVKRYVSVYKTMTETFLLCKNYKRAFEVERQTRILEDSIYAWRKLQVVEDIQLKYEAEKKNQEIASLTLQRLQQEGELTRNRYMIAGVLIFIAVAIAFSTFFYRKREKYYFRIRTLEAAQQVRQEKDRIARDLHDSLGSRLSTIALSLQRLQQETGNQSLSMIQEMTDNTMSELRDSIWAMNNDFIELEELEQRINTLFWQYRRLELPMELELHADLQPLRKLPSFLASNLFRIAQEAIHNAVKHSGASQIKVTLSHEANALSLIIADNGRGFEMNRAVEQKHFGLQNMHKRAEQISANLNISSNEKQGTRIQVTVPL